MLNLSRASNKWTNTFLVIGLMLVVTWHLSEAKESISFRTRLEVDCKARGEWVRKDNPDAKDVNATVLSRKELEKKTGDLLQSTHPWICMISYQVDTYTTVRGGVFHNATVSFLSDARTKEHLGMHIQGKRNKNDPPFGPP